MIVNKMIEIKAQDEQKSHQEKKDFKEQTGR
jgi:hypothetical protein